MERYNSVAGLPIDANRDRCNAFRGVLHDGEFPRAGPDQTRRREPYTFISRQPLVVVEAAEAQRVISQTLHRVGSRLAQRSHPGVIQIDERVSHWELVAIPIVNLETH